MVFPPLPPALLGPPFSVFAFGLGTNIARALISYGRVAVVRNSFCVF